MSANPIDRRRMKLCRQLRIDGMRPRRHSADAAKRQWYAKYRSARFTRHMAKPRRLMEIVISGHFGPIAVA